MTILNVLNLASKLFVFNDVMVLVYRFKLVFIHIFVTFVTRYLPGSVSRGHRGSTGPAEHLLRTRPLQI